MHVCKNLFCKALGIKLTSVAVSAAKKVTEFTCTTSDMRGRRKFSGISSFVKHNIKDHINSYHCMKPHYIRKSSKRRYLDSSKVKGCENVLSAFRTS